MVSAQAELGLTVLLPQMILGQSSGVGRWPHPHEVPGCQAWVVGAQECSLLEEGAVEGLEKPATVTHGWTSLASEGLVLPGPSSGQRARGSGFAEGSEHSGQKDQTRLKNGPIVSLSQT